jgi:hypothetical protein
MQVHSPQTLPDWPFPWPEHTVHENFASAGAHRKCDAYALCLVHSASCQLAAGCWLLVWLPSCSGGTVSPPPFCPTLLRPYYCCLSTLILDLHCFLHDTALLVIDLQNYMCNPGEWDQSALGAGCMHSQAAAACRGLLQRWA